MQVQQLQAQVELLQSQLDVTPLQDTTRTAEAPCKQAPTNSGDTVALEGRQPQQRQINLARTSGGAWRMNMHLQSEVTEVQHAAPAVSISL